MEIDDITGMIVDTAYRLHAGLGPGLLESVYEAVLYRDLASPHFSPPSVARRIKGAAWVAFATEERAGIADTMSSTPTERKPARACHWNVAVEGW